MGPYSQQPRKKFHQKAQGKKKLAGEGDMYPRPPSFSSLWRLAYACITFGLFVSAGAETTDPSLPKVPIKSNDDTRIMFEEGCGASGVDSRRVLMFRQQALAICRAIRTIFRDPLAHTYIHTHTLSNGFFLRISRFFKYVEVFLQKLFTHHPPLEV